MKKNTRRYNKKLNRSNKITISDPKTGKRITRIH